MQKHLKQLTDEATRTKINTPIESIGQDLQQSQLIRNASRTNDLISYPKQIATHHLNTKATYTHRHSHQKQLDPKAMCVVRVSIRTQNQVNSYLISVGFKTLYSDRNEIAARQSNTEVNSHPNQITLKATRSKSLLRVMIITQNQTNLETIKFEPKVMHADPNQIGSHQLKNLR